MHAAAAPPPPVSPALAVLYNAHDLLVRCRFDVAAARQRVQDRIHQVDHTSARAFCALSSTLQEVGQIEGECAEIRRAAGGIVWEIAL